MTEESKKVLLNILNERLELMRTLDKEGDSEQRRHIARETKELHAPLAHRLGLYAIKTEMEDLSLKFTDYDTYKYIAHALAQKKTEREEYIRRFIEPLSEKLTAAGFRFTIKGRPKSIHSIYHKMQAQHCDVDKIYDLFAIRIILDAPREVEKSQCWQVYSMITDLFVPNPKRMRDWLSVPKENGYESLHATVLGPEKRWVEVQIRSKRMDEEAEHGTASHFSYKGVDGRIINEEEEYVFVFTPRGDLKKFAEGATILDFAFSIHTEVGCHCSGGKVNGVNVPIRHVLENGDQVEILTSSTQIPAPSWLNVVTTSKAKNKIRQFLKEIEYKDAAEGREIIERRFKNWKMDYDEGVLSRLATRLGYKVISDLYQSVARGREDVLRLKEACEQMLQAGSTVRTYTEQEYVPKQQAMEIVVDLNAKVDLNLAPCCSPRPGDPIFGFITLTKGIRIHHCDCPNAPQMRERYPYRLLPARWK